MYAKAARKELPRGGPSFLHQQEKLQEIIVIVAEIGLRGFVFEIVFQRLRNVVVTEIVVFGRRRNGSGAWEGCNHFVRPHRPCLRPGGPDAPSAYSASRLSSSSFCNFSTSASYASFSSARASCRMPERARGVRWRRSSRRGTAFRIPLWRRRPLFVRLRDEFVHRLVELFLRHTVFPLS